MSTLVYGSLLWRVLVGAALVGARVTLDGVIPRGRTVRRVRRRR